MSSGFQTYLLNCSFSWLRCSLFFFFLSILATKESETERGSFFVPFKFFQVMLTIFSSSSFFVLFVFLYDVNIELL